MMLIEPLNLRLSRASCRQRRQSVHGEEFHGIRLVAERCRAPRELTQKKQLVDVQEGGWMAVFRIAPVEQRGQLHRLGQVAGFFANFSLHGEGRSIPYIYPAAGERPFAI